MGLRRALERFVAGQGTAEALREQIELAEARIGALEARLKATEEQLCAAKSRASILEAEKHFLEVQLMQEMRKHPRLAG